jgi:hypothetical protein
VVTVTTNLRQGGQVRMGGLQFDPRVSTDGITGFGLQHQTGKLDWRKVDQMGPAD